jgi:hypothetical protein
MSLEAIEVGARKASLYGSLMAYPLARSLSSQPSAFSSWTGGVLRVQSRNNLYGQGQLFATSCAGAQIIA